VQFLHLLSQVLLTTSTNNPNDSNNITNNNNSNKLLPPSNVMAEIINKICTQMNEKEIFKTFSSDD
jgi:hypothetical protein